MDCLHHEPFMFPFLFTLLLSFSFSVSLLFFSLYITRRRRLHLHHHHHHHHQSPPGISDIVYNLNKDVNRSNHKTLKPLDSTPANNALLLEILPAALFADAGELENKDEPLAVDDGKRKKKRRGKKKRSDADDSEKPEGDREVMKKEGLFIGGNKEEEKKQDLVCLYPFTSSSSATQRKIKQQYDQLVKSHESSGLTLLQVGQFVNCLIEAREELKHKSEVIQRKFTITRALLFKADRSSFDRLRQQIYKLELEQKRLEEDAFVYNWLQQQLKLSPAYKKMLEIGAYMDSKAKSGKPMEETDSDSSDISFEELLAQEKKDSFWQKKGKPRLCSDR